MQQFIHKGYSQSVLIVNDNHPTKSNDDNHKSNNSNHMITTITTTMKEAIQQSIPFLFSTVLPQTTAPVTLQMSMFEFHGTHRIRDLLQTNHNHNSSPHAVAQCSILNYEHDVKFLYNYALRKRSISNTLCVQFIYNQQQVFQILQIQDMDMFQQELRHMSVHSQDPTSSSSSLTPPPLLFPHTRWNEQEASGTTTTTAPFLAQALYTIFQSHEAYLVVCTSHSNRTHGDWKSSWVPLASQVPLHPMPLLRNNHPEITRMQQPQQHLILRRRLQVMNELILQMARTLSRMEQDKGPEMEYFLQQLLTLPPDASQYFLDSLAEYKTSNGTTTNETAPSNQGAFHLQEFQYKQQVQKWKRECQQAQQALLVAQTDIQLLQQEILQQDETTTTTPTTTTVSLTSNKAAHTEHLLRISQFREAEAIVCLRQLRRFYTRILQKHQGNNNFYDSHLIMDLDQMMVQAGLLETQEIFRNNEDSTIAPNQYCPSREALLKSTQEADRIHKAAKPTTNGQSIEPPSSPPSILHRESPSSVEERQRMHQSPAGQYLERQEAKLEEEVQMWKHKYRELAKFYEMEKIKVAACSQADLESDRVRAAQEIKHLKDQLERKNQDLQTVVLKWNEFHLVRETLVDKMTAREHHISYLEENLDNTKNELNRVLSEQEEKDEKIRYLETQLKQLSSPVWLTPRNTDNKQSLSQRLIVPFNMVNDAFDQKEGDQEKLTDVEKVLQKQAEEYAKSRSITRTRTECVDASVQTDPESSYSFNIENHDEPFRLEDQLFMAPSSASVEPSISTYNDIVNIYDSFGQSIAAEKANKAYDAHNEGTTPTINSPVTSSTSISTPVQSRPVLRHWSSPDKLENNAFKAPWVSKGMGVSPVMNQVLHEGVEAKETITTKEEDKMKAEEECSHMIPQEDTTNDDGAENKLDSSERDVELPPRSASTGSFFLDHGAKNIGSPKKISAFMNRIKAQAARKATEDVDQSQPEWLRKFKTIGAKNQAEEVIETSGAAEAKDLYAVRTEMGEALKKKNSSDLSALTVSAQSSASTSTWKPRDKAQEDSDNEDDAFAREFLRHSQSNVPQNTPDSESESSHDFGKNDTHGESSTDIGDNRVEGDHPESNSSKSEDYVAKPPAVSNESDSESEESVQEPKTKTTPASDSESDSSDHESKPKVTQTPSLSSQKTFPDESESETESEKPKLNDIPKKSPIKKKSFLDDSDSDSDSSDEEAKPKQIPRPLPVTKKSFLDDSDSDVSEKNTRPKTAPESQNTFPEDCYSDTEQPDESSKVNVPTTSKMATTHDSDSESESSNENSKPKDVLKAVPVRQKTLPDDSESSDSDEPEEKPKAVSPPAKRVIADDSDSDSESSEEESKSKVASTAAPVAKKSFLEDSDSDSDDSDDKPKVSPRTTPKTENTLPDDLESDNDEPEEKPNPPLAPMKVTTDESDSDSESSEEKPKPKIVPTAALVSKKSFLDESDSDSDDSDEKPKPVSRVVPVPVTKKPAIDSDAKSTPEKTKPPPSVKKESDSESSDEESEEESPRPTKKSIPMIDKLPPKQEAKDEDDPWATTHTRMSLGPADQNDLKINSPVKKASKTLGTLGSPRRTVPNFASDVSMATPSKKKKSEKEKPKFVIKDGKLVKSDDESPKKKKKKEASSKKEAPAFEIVGGKLVKKKGDDKKKKKKSTK